MGVCLFSPESGGGGFWVHQIPKAAPEYELFDWMSHGLLADSDLVMVCW